MAKANVVKFLKRKINGNYEEAVHIGAEQQFVSALRNSNNNNLEEQTLLGLDCVETGAWIGTVYHVVKEFHDGSKTKGFYLLDSLIYNAVSDSQIAGEEIQFNSNVVSIDGEFLVIQSEEASITGALDEEQILYVPQNFSSSLAVVNLNALDVDGFTKIQEDTLKYRKSETEDIVISTKTTWQKIDENKNAITKSIIVNNNNL